jgi:hypothetical protein
LSLRLWIAVVGPRLQSLTFFGASMISTCQEKKHFSLHSPEGFEARGYS